MTDDEEFFGSIEMPQDDAPSARLVAAFHELQSANAQVNELSALLDGAKSKVNELASKNIPELMRDMGTDIWRDPETGRALELVTAINSAMPKDQEKRNGIYDALRPIGIEEVLAEEFVIVFSPGDHRSAIVRRLLGLGEKHQLMEGDQDVPGLSNYETEIIDNARRELKLDQPLPTSEKLGVHPSRFKSWLKEKIERGFGTVITEAGIWHGKIAKIIEPDAKSKGKKK
jgi:hypothetical protein